MIMTNTNNTTKFETGKKYFCRSICDSDCVFEFEVVKRTEKTITIKNWMGETKRKKITIENGIEYIYPLGQYSMAPTLRSNKVVEEKEEQNVVDDEPRKEEQEMTRKEKITAIIDFEIANSEIEKEDRELEINEYADMTDFDLEVCYNNCFNPKWQEIKNEIKELINNRWFPQRANNQLYSQNERVDGHLEKVNFFSRNQELHMYIVWAEQDALGERCFCLTYPVNLSRSVDALLGKWVDYYWKRHLNQNTENNKEEIRKDENKMTKKEKIVACVDFEIENSKIKKSDRNFEINSRLNGCKWRPAMNNAELNSWYNDCFNPEYIEIKQELESKINSWLSDGNYKEAEFYDNGNGLFIKIVWQQKENEAQVSYSCHFPVKDFTIEAIFASWMEYAPQPQKNELTKIDAPKIENETTETQPSEVGKYFLFPYEFGKYYKFYVAEKKKKH